MSDANRKRKPTTETRFSCNGESHHIIQSLHCPFVVSLFMTMYLKTRLVCISKKSFDKQDYITAQIMVWAIWDRIPNASTPVTCRHPNRSSCLEIQKAPTKPGGTSSGPNHKCCCNIRVKLRVALRSCQDPSNSYQRKILKKIKYQTEIIQLLHKPTTTAFPQYQIFFKQSTAARVS
jgi:hypothetical protein